MEVGRVRRIDRRSDGAYLEIEARTVIEGTRVGDSISINGVDLTAVAVGDGYFGADASLETLGRSNLGELGVGAKVNLERALAVGERLGGHMVQGHVDGTGELLSVRSEGNAYRVRIRFPAGLGRYIAMKGSIAVDGISLTVAGLGGDWFEVAIIPHTWRKTALRDLKAGSSVNLEVDVLAKYVEKLLRPDEPRSEAAGDLTEEYLRSQGY